MKKVLSIVAVAVLSLSVLAGCAKAPTATATPTTTPAATAKVDAVTTASVTDNVDVFAKTIGKDGKWIICTTKDLTTTKELVLEGDFLNGKKDATTGKDITQRKIGLYTQDDKKVVTARFTLTAPKLTIKSPEASIQHGTFKGDLYVSVKNFQLVDAKVDGNVYFTTEEAQTTFKMDDKSSVTGKKELKK